VRCVCVVEFHGFLGCYTGFLGGYMDFLGDSISCGNMVYSTDKLVSSINMASKVNILVSSGVIWDSWGAILVSSNLI
jgi:hypothetical protein